jgi:hypothetical protein
MKGLKKLDNFREEFRSRRYKAYVNFLGTTQLHKRNPYTVACWSMAFPGFGHLLLNKYLRGYALVLWELFINQKIKLNTAMLYTFNGQFEEARQVLDPEFMYLYIPVYLFAIWDSYRTTVDLNKIYLLAERENGPVNEFSIGSFEINYLDKRKPWLAAAWSMGIPSMGQLYLNRIVLAFFILVTSMVLVWNSNLLLAVHEIILGHIKTSTEVLDPQWVLYFPSFYFFTIYDAYVTTTEHNKLFNDAQRNFLLQKYQPPGGIKPVGKKVD